MIGAFRDYLIELNMWQYYVFDVVGECAAVKAALEGDKVTSWAGPDVAHKTVAELAEIIGASGYIHGLYTLERRFCTSVDSGIAAGLVKAAFVDVQSSDALADAWVRVVDVLNVPLYAEWKEDMRIALDNIKNRIQYTRLDEHGPKLGPISEKCVLGSFVRAVLVIDQPAGLLSLNHISLVL